jgi:hypothetical protein
MKKLIIMLITITMLIAVVSPVLAAPTSTTASLEYENKAHGDHGLGWVNQNFNGVEVPPPWDLPPGLNR